MLSHVPGLIRPRFHKADVLLGISRTNFNRVEFGASEIRKGTTMKEPAKNKQEGAMDTDDINIIPRELEADELQKSIKAHHSVPRDKEVRRWLLGDSTVEISRVSHQPIDKVTQKVKKTLKTIIRKMGA